MLPLRRALLGSAVLAAFAVVACGQRYSAAPETPDADTAGEAGADAAAPADGAIPEPSPSCAPPTCALLAPPAGWQLVLLESSRADACPAGFDSADLIESPVADVTACACSACVTSGTKCATGTSTTSFDNGGGSCATPGLAFDASGGNCLNATGTLGKDARIGAPAAIVGTCTAAASGVRANVMVQAGRVCSRQASSCSNTACGAPASMKACIAAPGDVPCPSGATTKHLLGADFTLACPSCSCSITSATCAGTAAFYPQSNCTGTAVVLTANVCTATASNAFMSTKWVPTVASEKCATAAAAPTATLTATQTVCCP